MRLEAIIFDLEGTIIDTEKIWDETDAEFLRRHDRVYDPNAVKHLLMGGTMENVPLPANTAPVTLPFTGARNWNTPDLKVNSPASRFRTRLFADAVSPLSPMLRSC